jgi:hypothetical protein
MQAIDLLLNGIYVINAIMTAPLPSRQCYSRASDREQHENNVPKIR